LFFMNALDRIYNRMLLIENSTGSVGEFCIKHLGIGDKRSFHEFYKAYENWRTLSLKHRDAMLQQKMENELRHSVAFSPKQA
jgi:hypothetical protein